jgi:hypothetical protein
MAGLSQTLSKCGDDSLGLARRSAAEKSDYRQCRLLRAREDRQRRRTTQNT